MDCTNMFSIILYQPEIPPNTGNIIRLCANTGAKLHLIEPLGFTLEDKQLIRAGLDYHEFADIRVHKDIDSALAGFDRQRVFALTTRGSTRHDQVSYREGDAFIFGPESRGLPKEVLALFAEQNSIRLPMMPGNRSLNLSNSAAVVVFEAWRQLGFKGAN